MKMTKTKLFTIIAVLTGLAAVVMMFLPQINLGLKDITNAQYNVDVTWPAFFGGQVVFGDRSFSLNHGGSVLAFVGYCLLFVGTLFIALMLIVKTKGSRTALGFIAFLISTTGVIFVWCTKVNFNYVNMIDVGSSLGAYTITSINYGIGSLLGAIFGTISPVAAVAAICVDKGE